MNDHPHVVAVYDVVTDDNNTVWLVCEYLPSWSLADVLAVRHQLDPGEAAHIGAGIADAIAAAHAKDIVHRDVTPANVLISTDGRVKLADFGISRIADPGVRQVTGTAAYLAPEVASTGEATRESDVYSLGSTLYAAVEGAPPFGNSRDSGALLKNIQRGVIGRPRLAGPLAPILLRMLEFDPGLRPAAGLVSDELEKTSTGLSMSTLRLLPRTPVHGSDEPTGRFDAEASG
jgi:serine/threonine protein kinase